MDAETLKRVADAVEAGQRHPLNYEAEALRCLARADRMMNQDNWPAGWPEREVSAAVPIAAAQVFATLHAANMSAQPVVIKDDKP